MTHPSIEKARAAIERIDAKIPSFERWSAEHSDELSDIEVLQRIIDREQQPPKSETRSASGLIFKTNHNALVTQPTRHSTRKHVARSDNTPLNVLSDVIAETTGALARRLDRLEGRRT